MSLHRKNIGLPLFFSLIVLTAISGCGSPFMRNILNSKPGSLRHPFEVKNESDLLCIGNPDSSHHDWGLDKHYIQVESFEIITYSWEPIGSVSKPFTGSYNGQGHSIKNLSIITGSSEEYIGLFGFIETPGADKDRGVVKNVILDNVQILHPNNKFVGALVGYNNRGTVENCTSSGSINGNEQIGGIVGRNKGIILGCSSSGSVNGKMYIGGVAGMNEGGTVKNSFSFSEIQGDTGVGGVIGYNFGGVKYCYSAGGIKQNDGGYNIGGIVGENEYPGTVSNCYSTSNISAIASSSIGGVVGLNAHGSIIENCYATGVVSGLDIIAGITGWNYGTVENCVALNIEIIYINLTIGRVVAITEITGVLKNNFGLDHMPPNYGTWYNPTGNEFNGANVHENDHGADPPGSIGYKDFDFWNLVVGFDFSGSAWKWKSGCLPYLLNDTPTMPGHLQ